MSATVERASFRAALCLPWKLAHASGTTAFLFAPNEQSRSRSPSPADLNALRKQIRLPSQTSGLGASFSHSRIARGSLAPHRQLTQDYLLCPRRLLENHGAVTVKMSIISALGAARRRTDPHILLN